MPSQSGSLSRADLPITHVTSQQVHVLTAMCVIPPPSACCLLSVALLLRVRAAYGNTPDQVLRRVMQVLSQALKEPQLLQAVVEDVLKDVEERKRDGCQATAAQSMGFGYSKVRRRPVSTVGSNMLDCGTDSFAWRETAANHSR